MSFEAAQQVADAVLYEGYLLYPYRASAGKNQVRWQFGVLTPRAWSEQGSGEPWASQTECLLETEEAPVLHLRARFLQLQAKTVEAAVDRAGETFRAVPSLDVDGKTLLTWDEGVDREVDATVAVDSILGTERSIPFDISGTREVAPIRTGSGEIVGRVVRERWPLSGQLSVSAERLDGPYGVVKLRVRLENVTAWDDQAGSRDEALRRSLVAAHILLGLTNGRFVSLLDHPEWAGPAVATCDNLHTFPVLVGEDGRRDLMLSSPIILYDYPTIAPESPGDLFDATEIDEILTLRTMSLTEDEKREARATDPRAAAIIDRVDTMPAEMMDKLHGAVRYLREVTGAPPPQEPERVPWWDPGMDASVSPETDSVRVGGVDVARGSQVRLRPGVRRADAQDMFLAGRVANVEAVLFDVDDAPYLAVTLTDDPGADLQQAHGRFLYFAPDEVEPVEAEA
ncbi:MAG: hypothetical protein ACRDJW_21600 [Thermomicrobiales bacterium]